MEHVRIITMGSLSALHISGAFLRPSARRISLRKPFYEMHSLDELFSNMAQ